MRRFVWITVAVVALSAWAASSAQAQIYGSFRIGPSYGYGNYYYPTPSYGYYNYSPYNAAAREWLRQYYHSRAHQYPMTHWQHRNLHNQLDHDRYHDYLQQRRWYGYSPYYYYGSPYVYPRW